MQGSSGRPCLGEELSILLESFIDGNLKKIPLSRKNKDFAGTWLPVAARDHDVKHATSLLKGVHFFESTTRSLAARINRSRELLGQEISWINETKRYLEKTGLKIQKDRERLHSLAQEMVSALQRAPLREFTSDREMEVLVRISSARKRLSLLESAAEGRRDPSSAADESGGLNPAGEEDGFLRKIRENAYRNLLESKNALSSIRTNLQGIEGKIWLLAKGRVVETEERTRNRVAAANGMALPTLEKIQEVEDLHNEKKARMKALLLEIDKNNRHFSSGLEARISDLGLRIAKARGKRIVHLASQNATRLDEIEARVVFTAADIEITSMEEQIRALQRSDR